MPKPSSSRHRPKLTRTVLALATALCALACGAADHTPTPEPAVSADPTEVQSGDGRVLANQMGKCLGMRIDERISQADMPYYVANSEAASVVISFDIVLPRGVTERGPGEVLYLSLRVYPPDS